jgi:hypothetical protein
MTYRRQGSKKRPEAFYAAHLEDLGPADLVIVECVCGHFLMLTARDARNVGRESYETVFDL